MELDHFREFLLIDKDNLDEEVVRQPEFYFEVAKASVELTSKKDFLYEKAKRVEAERTLAIKKMLDDQGVRATEMLVNAHLKNDALYQQARNEFLEAAKEAELASALKSAFFMRGQMLRDLVQLYMSEYYGTNSIKEGGMSYEKRQKEYEELKKKIAEARRSKNAV